MDEPLPVEGALVAVAAADAVVVAVPESTGGDPAPSPGVEVTAPATTGRPPRTSCLRSRVAFFVESPRCSDSAIVGTLAAVCGALVTGGASVAFAGEGMMVSTGTMPPLPVFGGLPAEAGIFKISAPATNASAPARATIACLDRALGMGVGVGVGVIRFSRGVLMRPGVSDE